MSEQSKRQLIISLLTMPTKKIASLDEADLIRTIQDIEAIKADSVKDGRFLGKLTRRR